MSLLNPYTLESVYTAKKQPKHEGRIKSSQKTGYKTYQRVSRIACLIRLLLLHLAHHDLVAVLVLVHLLLLHHHLLLLHHVGLLFGVHLLMFFVLLLIHYFEKCLSICRTINKEGMISQSNQNEIETYQ